MQALSALIDEATIARQSPVAPTNVRHPSCSAHRYNRMASKVDAGRLYVSYGTICHYEEVGTPAPVRQVVRGRGLWLLLEDSRLVRLTLPERCKSWQRDYLIVEEVVLENIALTTAGTSPLEPLRDLTVAGDLIHCLGESGALYCSGSIVPRPSAVDACCRAGTPPIPPLSPVPIPGPFRAVTYGEEAVAGLTEHGIAYLLRREWVAGSEGSPRAESWRRVAVTGRVTALALTSCGYASHDSLYLLTDDGRLHVAKPDDSNIAPPTTVATSICRPPNDRDGRPVRPCNIWGELYLIIQAPEGYWLAIRERYQPIKPPRYRWNFSTYEYA